MSWDQDNLESLDTLRARIRALRGQSDRIPERAKLCRQALELVSRQIQPKLWAGLHFELGFCLMQMWTRDGVQILEEAMIHFGRAQKIFTRLDYPDKWASVQHNLGTIYRRLSIVFPVERQSSIESQEKAIQCYEKALQIFTQEDYPQDWADVTFNLANVYLQRIQGEPKCNLKRAIILYERTLQVYKREVNPAGWAEVQCNLGTAWKNYIWKDRSANVEKAINCYQAALLELNRHDHPRSWARAWHGLGVAWWSRVEGDREENLKKAIKCYEEALTIRRRETAPMDWAETMHNLAVSYAQHSRDGHIANLKRAAEIFEQVLEVRISDNVPLEWAETTYNLANVYLNSFYGGRLENIERAIRYYQKALAIQRRSGTCRDQGPVLHNLAVAYSERLIGNQAENLERAVSYGKEALEAFDRNAVFEWATVKTDLVDILWKVANLVRRYDAWQAMTYIEEAIAQGEEVVSVLENQPLSRYWALAHYNLGNAYSDYLTGDRADNQDKAIEHYNRALTFYTQQDYPVRWADTHNNLGVTYQERIRGGPRQNSKRATYHFGEALKASTADTFPVSARRAARNLANLYFEQQSWRAALDTYRDAMEAGEQLYRAGFSAESKMVEVAENVALYRNAAFAAAHLGNRYASDALLILEHGKTRLLAEAVRWRIPCPDGVPDGVWAEYEQAGAAVRGVQYESVPIVSGRWGDSPMEAYTTRELTVREANDALERAIRHVQKYDQGFLEDLDLSDILALLPDDHTALAAFCITDHGGISFVVSRSHRKRVQMVNVPGLTSQELGTLIQRWVSAYQSQDGSRWFSAIESVLAEVGKRLSPVLDALSPDIEKLILLPSGGLFLLPLHAVPLGGNAGCLLDRFQVSYAPSVEVLLRCQERAARAQSKGLFAAVNPTGDLAYAESEASVISSCFKGPCAILKHQDAVKEKVLAQAGGHGYVHFSCHGRYNWDNPSHSALLLAGSLKRDQDGQPIVDYRYALTLAEVQAKLNLGKIRLITFSACETGLSEATGPRAEEYVGLPAGFLMAGVPTVVASLWAVYEISTALLMERFYENHICGIPGQGRLTRQPLPSDEALRRAQIWLRDEVTAQEVKDRCKTQIEDLRRREEIVPTWLSLAYRRYATVARKTPHRRPFAHPFYWAAFTLSGATNNPDEAMKGDSHA